MSCCKVSQGANGIKRYDVIVERELIEAVVKALAAGEVQNEVVDTHRYGRRRTHRSCSGCNFGYAKKVPVLENQPTALRHYLGG